jgi:hypothetical protein
LIEIDGKWDEELYLVVAAALTLPLEPDEVAFAVDDFYDRLVFLLPVGFQKFREVQGHSADGVSTDFQRQVHFCLALYIVRRL